MIKEIQVRLSSCLSRYQISAGFIAFIFQFPQCFAFHNGKCFFDGWIVPCSGYESVKKSWCFFILIYKPLLQTRHFLHIFYLGHINLLCIDVCWNLGFFIYLFEIIPNLYLTVDFNAGRWIQQKVKQGNIHGNGWIQHRVNWVISKGTSKSYTGYTR